MGIQPIGFLPLVLIISFLVLPLSTSGLTFESDVSGINYFTATDKISWSDSRGLPRTAYFAKDYTNYPKARCYITRYEWNTDETTTISCNESGAAGTLSGLCLTVNHQSGNWSTQKKDGFNFQQSPKFLGDHHIIYRCEFDSYGKVIGGNVFYHVTVDWVFADGLDYFLYAITYDCSDDFIADGNPFGDDSRSPYTVFDWDGNGTINDSDPDDTYTGFQYAAHNSVFTTPDMAHYTFLAESNSIPFVRAWFDQQDREFGLVQTQSYSAHVGGGDVYSAPASSGTSLPGAGSLAYQMNVWQGYKGTRVTWGLPYGTVDGGAGTSAPYQSYSIAVTIDKKSADAPARLRTENKAIYAGEIVLSASQGTVIASGYEGCANPTIQTLDKPGYNHVYRCWEVLSDNGTDVAFTFDCGASSYQTPIFVIKGYSDSDGSCVITKNGILLEEGTDYTVSLDDTDEQLWVTMLGSYTGSNSFVLSASGVNVTSAREKMLDHSPSDIGDKTEKVLLYDLTGALLGRITTESLIGKANLFRPGISGTRIVVARVPGTRRSTSRRLILR